MDIIWSLVWLLQCALSYGLPANNGSANFIEGDIRRIATETFPENALRKGKIQFAALRNETYKWTKGIVPYSFDNTFPHDSKAEVERSMNVFHNKSCIKFVPRTNEMDYIEIIDVRGFCYSDVGRTGGKQIISLSQPCFDTNTILHELMHALGFHHEHNRPDRDEYIKIDFGKLTERYLDDFKKQTSSDVTHHSTLYDYKSVMHYPAIIKGKQVITPRYSGIEIKANGLSEIDIWEINKHYSCDQEASSTETETQTVVTTSETTISTSTATTRGSARIESNGMMINFISLFPS